jgi:hypothetical protein
MTFHSKHIKQVRAGKPDLIQRTLLGMFQVLMILLFLACSGQDPPVVSTPTPTSTPVATETASPSLTPTVEPTNTATQTPAPTLTVTLTSTLASGEAILVGAGDISSCRNDNDELTAKLLDMIPGTVFTTGDNAYDSGTVEQFTECYGPTWGRHKDRTKPIPGNHEYRDSDGAGYFEYFNGIESYYAYNLGGWRIYALNSEIDLSANSDQVAWLQADLAAHPSQCVLAYWHQPRWSSGLEHGNDRDYQDVWQILYAAGAELVVNAHEHHYERFAEMNAQGEAASPGLREIVVGTGGRSLYPFGRILPASEVHDNSTYGVLKLTLHASSYEWEFIPVEGSTFTDRGSTNCH